MDFDKAINFVYGVEPAVDLTAMHSFDSALIRVDWLRMPGGGC